MYLTITLIITIIILLVVYFFIIKKKGNKIIDEVDDLKRAQQGDYQCRIRRDNHSSSNNFNQFKKLPALEPELSEIEISEETSQEIAKIKEKYTFITILSQRIIDFAENLITSFYSNDEKTLAQIECFISKDIKERITSLHNENVTNGLKFSLEIIKVSLEKAEKVAEISKNKLNLILDFYFEYILFTKNSREEVISGRTKPIHSKQQWSIISTFDEKSHLPSYFLEKVSAVLD